MMRIEKKIRGVWVIFGISRRFGLGFSLDGYSFTLDIGPMWFTIEYWDVFWRSR